MYFFFPVRNSERDDLLRKRISSLVDTGILRTPAKKKLTIFILKSYRIGLTVLPDHINQNVLTIKYQRREKLQLHEKDCD